MRLEANGIYLRPPTPDDAEAVVAAAHESMESVGRWLPWCTPNYSIDDALGWMKRTAAADESSFVIIDATSDDFVGSCSLNQFDPLDGRANLGYWIRQSKQGRGIASAAARRVAEYGIRERRLNRIEIIAAVGNIASQRVAEKTGAIREGVLRDRVLVAGRRSDAVMFSLLPADLP